MTDQAAQGSVIEPADANLDDVIPEDDPEVANYPPMATGNNCTKNWDTSLLQNCTGDRMKAIAAALDVPVTTRVRKNLSLEWVLEHIKFYINLLKCYEIANETTFPK